MTDTKVSVTPVQDHLVVLAPTVISKQRIADLLNSAFETPMGEWLENSKVVNRELLNDPNITHPKDLNDLKYRGPSRAWAALAGNGAYTLCTVEAYLDEHNNKSVEIVFDFEKVQRGLRLLAEGKDEKGHEFSRRHWKNFISDNDDAETSDVFLQLCLLGGIVFG